MLKARTRVSWGRDKLQRSERWNIQLDEGVLGEVKQRNLYGGHIVESVVQLLADGFVLQFLSIQLVYDQEVEGRGARTWRVIKR